MSGREQDRSPDPGGEAPATKGQAPRRCAVCSGPLTWPSVEFCSAACGETWIRQARDREREPAVAVPGPGGAAKGRRRGRARG